ncbi:IucA/IucC family protein [Cohnella panacarvi]|uniref:IucA/IucC family protein n=1 Tax=Cohnella panacarvi TaxID=400776 RepID=UPI0004794824|nr:IucA/IucC family protein [Cohnella panacarvi]
MNNGLLDSESWRLFLKSGEADAARERVRRQLFESLVHEQLVAIRPIAEESSDRRQWAIEGSTRQEVRVRYLFKARRTAGFGRIRIESGLRRQIERSEQGDWADEAIPCSMAELLEELVAHDPEATPDRLAAFAQEMEHTIVNDALHSWLQRPDNGIDDVDSLTYWEGKMSFAHPYHPCYKSRIGFTLDDHLNYAPEFNPSFGLHWLAVQREWLETRTLSDLDYGIFIEQVIGTGQIERFRRKLRESGYVPEHYEFMPVHPWQWRFKLAADTAALTAENAIVPLGAGEERYRPLQSIRTLANGTDPAKPYVKTAMNLLNTSALRVIGAHHIRNAPVISEWLDGIVRQDDYLQRECRVVVLRETAGAALRYDRLPEPLGRLLNGAASAVFRESIEPMLAAGERAVPYTYVTHRESGGKPIVQDWLQRYGVREWLARLLEVTMDPQLHLLYAYGIGLEAHGQNMVLIHREGWPERIALRDLPGGIRCMEDGGMFRNRPEIPPLDVKPGDTHPIMTDSPAEVRDYWLDGFMHIQLHEIALLFEEAFDLDESIFWNMVASRELAYRSCYPEWKERYELFDLGAPTVSVGQLTARKIRGEGEGREHAVPNPLSAAIRGGQPIGVDARSEEGESVR